jgi:OHCU decarboxylase
MDQTRLPVTAALVPISQLNALQREDFASALQPLFEAAAPLADALYTRRPFDSYLQLIEHAETVFDQLPRADRLEIVNAHPRIGDRVAASSLSYAEQGYDRDGATDPGNLAATSRQLHELNQEYEARFGFRFVVFVNRRPKSALVDVLRERLQRTPAEELRTGLSEMLKIARDRLQSLESARG